MKPMGKHEYRKAIKALDLSQKRAADFLGIGGRTSAGYALGEEPVPKVIAMFLRLMIRLKLRPADIE